MLVQALFDFIPRAEDSRKALGFHQGEILMFIDVYPNHHHWLKVTNRKGQIGYIPRNYVEIVAEVDRDSILDFILEACLVAKREKLDSVESLEAIKDHAVRVEYREFQSRMLRSAMAYKPDPEHFYDLNNDNGLSRRSSIQNLNPLAQKVMSNTTVQSRHTEQSRRTSKTEPTPQFSQNFTQPLENNNDLSPEEAHEELDAFKTARNDARRRSENSVLGDDMNMDSKPMQRSIRSLTQVYENKSKLTGEFQNSQKVCAYDLEVQKGSGDQPDLSQTKFVYESPVKRFSKSKIPVRFVSRSNSKVHEDSPGLAHKEANNNLEIGDTGEDEDFRLSAMKTVNWESLTGKLIKITHETAGIDMKQSETIVRRLFHHMYENFEDHLPEAVQSVLHVLQDSNSFTTEQPSSSSKIQKVFESLSEIISTQLYANNEKKFLGGEGNNSNSNSSSEQLLQTLDDYVEELQNMDARNVKTSLRADQYRNIHDLVLLYKSDKRDLVKMKLLEVFTMMATLDSEAKSILLRSILPIELAREIMEQEEDGRMVSALTSVLSLLLSSEEQMPATHFDIFGESFVSFALDFVDREQGAAAEDMLDLILQLNTQFSPFKENLCMRMLVSQPARLTFIEALVKRFTQEVENVEEAAVAGRKGREMQNPTFKFLKDMFASKLTAEHFNKAAMKQLMDTMIQALGYIQAGDSRRAEFLALLRLVTRNRGFNYRVSDIRDILVGILAEEDQLSSGDQQVVREIYKEFPNIFKKLNSGMQLGNSSVQWKENEYFA